MKKPVRLLLLGAAAVVGLLLVVVAVAFNSSFQTWATRKVLAKNPDVHVTLGSVDAGLKHVEVKDLRFEQDGAILTLPAVAVDLPVLSAGLGQKVLVSRLVAKGWTLDLSKTAATAPAPSGAAVPVATPSTASAALVAQAFAGVFGRLQLPVDISVDDVQLEGEVILPEARGRAKVTFTGGGLGSGREGKFDLGGEATLADEKVSKLTLRGALAAAMDTPRTFTRFTAKLDAAATGTQFPNGVKLTADLAAARSAAGENYSVTVEGARPLLTVRADFPTQARQLDGTWKLDVSDADVAPFALGRPLPGFTAVGEGKIATDATFTAIRASGRLNATADRLAAVRPELASIGAVKFTADFDVAQRGPAIAVERLDASVAGAQPIATVRTLQAFTLDPKTRELKAADPARELIDVALQGVPLAWLKPFLNDIAVSGGDLRGDLVAATRSGGLTVRSKTPLVVTGVSVAQAGKPLLKNVDVALTITADYAPQGWQAEIGTLTVKSGGATLLTLDAKAGQLAGKDQPLKATGKFTADLPACLAQPVGAGTIALVRGEATAEFVASLGAKQELQAKVGLQNLATDPKVLAEKLPAISTELRVDIAPGGTITVNAPLVLERDGRKSDLTLAGTLTRTKEKLAFDAQVTSKNLVFDDAKVLAALAPAGPKPTAATTAAPAADKPARDAAPPWAGVDGTLKLALKNVVYSDTLQAGDVSGTIRVEGGALKLEKLGAVLPEGGESRVNGTVTFNGAAPQPYALNADVMLKDFDPAPFFRALNPQQPPTVEGKFNMTSKVTGQAATLADLPAGAVGDFQMASRGGVYRGFPVNVSNTAETTGRVAGWIASAGTAIGALTGKKEYTDIGSKAQALAEFTTLLRAIPYDQLGVVVTRDSALNGTLKDFTLISPEIRLTGTGTTLHRTGASPLDDAISMEFKLRARGRAADLLKHLGKLESDVDNLGYAGCTLPLKVRGTVGKPDTSELNGVLAALVLEKSGVTDKASDLLNRLIGGGK